MKKHIYFLNENNTGSLYGVGTYMNNLLQVLPPEKFCITIICLYTDFAEITVRKKGALRSIYIPNSISCANSTGVCKNVFHALYPYIKKEENNILHLNFRSLVDLVVLLREHFSFRVVLIWHFFSGIDFAHGKVFENIIQGANEEGTISFNNTYKETIAQESLLMQSFCDKVILVANHSYRPIRSIYQIPDEKLKVIYNCLPDIQLESSKQSVRKAFHFLPEEKIILFVGRLDHNKNASLLIQSFHTIRLQNPTARLVIAGDGDFHAPFSVLYPDYARITFTGFLNQEKLHQLYTIADIGVIPSHYEEFGYVALEMMRHKLPVIANRTSGLAEIIEDGISGELVDLYAGNRHEESVDLLSKTVISLLNDPKRQTKYAVNGRRRYLDTFGIESFKRKMWELYDEL